ncbi:hypothetical protein [Actinoplanes palleronii]|uniref:Uncharacterized protein n=1 Tax=Actinoplanes palleronii TaxID=113570 RepID=A0ABQ4BQX4_9ACTN|nr:hypothetical protein [Actinoplanes palleronii]GIE73059.1 hypothetical protein Apa02nite_091670 [Actinoplanes palleronii]
MSATSWPSSPLQAAQRAFSLLLTPPTAFTYDTSEIEALACGPVPLDRLRGLLLCARTTPQDRDIVWRDLVMRARRDGPGWVIAAAGVAMPGLRRAARRLATGWPGDVHDLDAELLTGFVAALRTVDVDSPRICGRLIEAGVRAARKVRDASAEQVARIAGIPGPALPARPADHPDFVLARAVAVGVVDADEAYLIGATRLEGASLAQAGEQRGISPQLASTWRTQAEARLRAAIQDGDLAFVTLNPRLTKAIAEATPSASSGNLLANTRRS